MALPAKGMAAAAEVEPSGDDDLQLVAEDLISAVKAGDAGAVAAALRAAHEICAGYSGE